ncbi:MAG: hypothetical protein HY040_14470 [Planctomycetes bacterium]|nr:hypothetical protein [Planctomycetota bacterium]
MVRAAFFAALACVLFSGCLLLPDNDSGIQTVSHNPFDVFTPARAATKVNYSPASQEVALRVDFVGRKILAENPQIGMKPLFATAGSAKEEIFHQDTRMVWITEGLVKQCKEEGELAALMALELAKMVAERETTANPQVRQTEQRLPINVPIGNAGQFHDQDQTGVAELARYEKNNPKKAPVPARPNAQNLARGYLEKAGFHRTDLDRIEPLLQRADRNFELERQMKGLPPQSNWTP